MENFKTIAPKVKELYIYGNSNQEIAELVGMKTSSINYILYRIIGVGDYNPRKNLMDEMPKELVNRIVTLACWGYSKKEIAEDVKIKYKLVYDIIKEATDKKIIQKFC
jgi:DNA-binding CsgD family transcriptional regulator